MANWYDALPGFEDREAMREFVSHRKDGGEDEPSAVGEDTSGEYSGAPKVPTLEAAQIMQQIRYRKEVPGASETEVIDARTNMMRNLSMQHMQMHAARDDVRNGKVKMVMMGEDGRANQVKP